MHAVILSLDDPWERSHGGTQRTRLFCEAFRDLGHEVTCIFAAGGRHRDVDVHEGVLRVPAPMTPAGDRPLPPIVKRAKRALLPLPTVAGSRSRTLGACIRDHGPFDVMVVQQLRTAPYFEDAPEARSWFDQVDLWSRVARIESAQRRRLPRATSLAQMRCFARAEQRCAAAAAVVSAAGYEDARALERISGRPVSWLPSAAVGATDYAGLPPPDGRVAGLLANFSYWPNRDAYRTLARAWAPRLIAAGWRVVVAGHESSALLPADGIEILGPVAAPSAFYERVAVTLAPIRLGGGIKIKVLESLVARRPVIASPMAVEGFDERVRALIATVDVEDPDFGFLRDGPPVIDDESWAAVRERFSPARFRDGVAAQLASLG